MAFSSVECNVVAASTSTFIIIIHDLIMPNSDFKFYTVGVVPCNAQKKYQLLLTISCGHKIVYNEPHLFFPQTAVVHLHTCKHWGSSCVRNCFGNIYEPI